MSLVGTQIDHDRQLLQFETYEQYLDSFITQVDLLYLRSTTIARQVAKLGYRCTGDTLDRKSFYRRLAAVRNLLFPVYKPYVLCSELTTPTDALQAELALRERDNRLGVSSTIIFICYYIKSQSQVSGYIDFAHRLDTEDWLPFFQGKKKLRLLPRDLAYFHWKSGKALLNETSNYQPMIDTKKGLLFKNSHDRRIIYIDPLNSSPSVATSRVRVRSNEYEHVVLYDHTLRSKL